MDTKTVPIDAQTKRIYTCPEIGVFFSNQFDGARMNALDCLNDSIVKIHITPENEPINQSAYYAFKVWSKHPQSIYIQLDYDTFQHRYIPKLSHNGTDWSIMDSMLYFMNEDTTQATLKLDISEDTLWVSAQELKTSAMIDAWSQALDTHAIVQYSSIGKSRLGRDIPFLNIGQLPERAKSVVVLLCRQHPPEVPGQLVFEAFVEELMNDTFYSAFFQRYQIWAFPLLNPDGVDLGHWRHSSAGIDLNRDWAKYRQPEIRQIVDFIAEKSHTQHNPILLGIDFHATQEDIYYTLMDSMPHQLQDFHHYWIDAIDCSLPAYNSKTEPYGLTTPISKGWFYQYFKAESITFEIGDETPRDFISLKGHAAAREMVKLLMEVQE